jgi:hypothetical protein
LLAFVPALLLPRRPPAPAKDEREAQLERADGEVQRPVGPQLAGREQAGVGARE